MSTYLGRLVDRAVGPPASALSPRLAPVFPLGRVEETEPEPVHAESSPEAPDVRDARPAAPAREVKAAPADTPERSVTARHSPAGTELRKVRLERPEPREPFEAIEASVAETPQIRKDEHTTLEHSTVGREAERGRPATAPVLAAPRVERQPVPVAPRDGTSVREPPRIEVRIGRVEVRRPHEPDPVEWPAPAPVQPAATGFGELAASRRYVDRSWS
jgi:hypothetical protein